MFYNEAVLLLRTDSAIIATVSTYNNLPAIFANEAPEGAEKPYIIIRIDVTPLLDRVIASSNLYIDYYDYDNSRVLADSAIIAIENRVDSNMIRTENLTDIRFRLMNTGYIPESDARTIHHNSTFSCRAARSGWMQRNKNQ